MKSWILWFGLEGRSTYDFLTQKQWVWPEQITIFDEKKDIEVPEGANAVLWENCYDKLIEVDQIWRTPGITKHILETKLGDPSQLEEILAKCTSQTQYFLDHYEWFVIWVTGTKGKSMTSTAMYHTLDHAWLSVQLVGNVWKPVLETINFEDQPDYVVYEMSSFMIESLWDYQLDVGILNTLYSTHTREHNGFDPYAAAKRQITEHSKQVLLWSQAASAYANLGFSAPDTANIYWDDWKYTFQDSVFAIDGNEFATDEQMLVLWAHNRYNFCSIVWVCDLLDIDKQYFVQMLQNFWGLEHRMEKITSDSDIIWINDAIATTPQATMAALDTFADQVDTLLYWGIEWDYDHSGVIELIKKYKISNLVLFPDSGHHISDGLDADHYTILETRSMEEAVAFARSNTKKWSIALLSCWSPSFSCWSGFKEKGNLFKKYVLEQ